MDKSKFVFCASAVCLTAAFRAGGALAEDQIPETAIYADMSVKSTVTYALKDGSSATLTNGSDLVVSAQFNGNTSPDFSWELHSLTFDATRAGGFWTDGGYVSVGEGGITFLQNDVWMAGRPSETDRRITIAADQEWKGTETDPGETVRAAIYVGATFDVYYRMGLGVSDGVTLLTLSRYLDAWFSGQNTKMGNLDLTVKAPARLRLVNRKGNPASDIDGRLGCRSLTLAGDGDALALGSLHAACDGTHMYLTPYLDVPHFASVLNLVDGADLAMNTTYATVGTFAIPTVNVTKPGDAVSDGVSAISGPFVVTQELTTVTLAGDPTLDFTGATLTESGVAAGWNISGVGTIKFSGPGYRLTGPLSLGSGTTVKFFGAVNLMENVFTAAADATVELDPGEGVEMAIGDLEDFAGTIRLKSGKTIFNKGVGAATVVEDGGVKIVSGGLVVTDETYSDAAVTVGASEAMYVYGSGLTAATTVTLDGGRIVFVRSAVMKSPLNVTRTSSGIYAEGSSVTGEVNAVVTVDVGNSTGNGLVTYGKGAIVLSGGMTLADLGNGRLVQSGHTLVFKTGDYNLGSGGFAMIATNTSATAVAAGATYPVYCGIRDGAVVHFADQRSGAGVAKTCFSTTLIADGSNYDVYPSTVEIGEGGHLEFPWNSYAFFGSNQEMMKVKVTGGTLVKNCYGKFCFGTGGYSVGELTMTSGKIVLNQPFVTQDENERFKFYWDGGTVEIGPQMHNQHRTLIEPPYGVASPTKLMASVEIRGEDCVLDLKDYALSSFTNVPSNFSVCDWVGTGTLTVRGGTTCKELVMNSIPSGVGIRLENGAKVVVPENARVYDPAKWEQGWRRPYPAAYDDTAWLLSDAFDLKEYVVAGEDVGFTYENLSSVNSVATIRIAEGGVYDPAANGLGGAAWPFTDVTFETGATWTVGAMQLAVPGTLTFGETIRIAESSRPAYAPVLATAGEALIGAPEVIKAGRRKVECVFDAVKRKVIQTFKGMAVLVR